MLEGRYRRAVKPAEESVHRDSPQTHNEIPVTQIYERITTRTREPDLKGGKGDELQAGQLRLPTTKKTVLHDTRQITRTRSSGTGF